MISTSQWIIEMKVTAKARYIRVSPRKARLVADLIRGRMVSEALNILSLTQKKSAKIIEKVLKSAISNAEENHKAKDTDSFIVKSIIVDGGPMWKRFMPRAKGSVTTIRKRTSHISLVIGD